MPTAYSYIRFSSGKQAKGSSKERQESMIAEWLRSHADYELSLQRYEDLGRSGYKGEHLKHGFGKLLDAIDEGLIRKGDAVLVEAIDRLGRLPPMQTMNLLSSVASKGVVIVTLEDGIEYTERSINTEHWHSLAGKIKQAHEYSERLAERMRRSWQSRQRQAKSGNAIKRRLPIWLNQETGQLNPEIAPHVAQAFEDYAAGMGERRILKRLKQKCPEIKITPGGIQMWWGNRTAIGYWNDTPNCHPPVITMELWYRVAQARYSRKREANAAPTKHFLTGLIKCGACGKNYGVKQNVGRTPVMKCSTNSRLGFDGCSNGKTFPVAVLDSIRLETCQTFIQEAFLGQMPSEQQKQLIEIEGEYNEVVRKLDNLAAAIAQTGPLDSFVRESNRLTEVLRNLESQRTILERENLSPSRRTHEFFKVEDDLIKNDPLKLNSLLQGVGYTIVCHADGTMIPNGGKTYRYRFSRKNMNFLVSSEDESWVILCDNSDQPLRRNIPMEYAAIEKMMNELNLPFGLDDQWYDADDGRPMQKLERSLYPDND